MKLPLPANPWRTARFCLFQGSATLSLTALVGGCANLPDDQDLRTITSADSYAAAKSFAADEGVWPSDNWWLAFEDPQLKNLIEEGLAGAPDIRLASARLDAAVASAGLIDARLSPTFDTNASGGEAKQGYKYIIPESAIPRAWKDFCQGTLNLGWNLDFRGKNRAAAATRLILSTVIASAYGDLARSCAELETTQDSVAIREKQTERVSAMTHGV